MKWNLSEAKNKLSEVFNKTLEEGPQEITRYEQTVFMVSEEEFKRLSGQKPSFKEFLINSNIGLSDLDLRRNQSPMRDIEW